MQLLNKYVLHRLGFNYKDVFVDPDLSGEYFSKRLYCIKSKKEPCEILQLITYGMVEDIEFQMSERKLILNNPVKDKESDDSKHHLPLGLKVALANIAKKHDISEGALLDIYIAVTPYLENKREPAGAAHTDTK